MIDGGIRISKRKVVPSYGYGWAKRNNDTSQLISLTIGFKTFASCLCLPLVESSSSHSAAEWGIGRLGEKILILHSDTTNFGCLSDKLLSEKSKKNLRHFRLQNFAYQCIITNISAPYQQIYASIVTVSFFFDFFDITVLID